MDRRRPTRFEVDRHRLVAAKSIFDGDSDPIGRPGLFQGARQIFGRPKIVLQSVSQIPAQSHFTKGEY